MTDKEKEAIERCNQLIKVEHSNWIGISNQKAIETILDLIQTQQEEIEDCKKCVLRDEVHNYIEEIEKKDTLINTMQAEFERLEDLEDNTDMLKLQLQKKDKIIDEIAGEIIRILYYCDGKVGKYKTPYVEESISKTHENIKEYFINKVEKESK